MGRGMVLKLVVLGGVSLVLLLVLSSIGGLARERKSRLGEVERSIAESYAGRQCVTGPVFNLAIREWWTERLYNKDKDSWYDKEMSEVRAVLVFPEAFAYEGALTVQERYRGIFKANVFQSKGRVTGSVVFPAGPELVQRENSRVEVVSAQLCLLVSDQRGISTAPSIEWKGAALKVEPGCSLDDSGRGIHADLPEAAGLPGQRVGFGLDLSLHGMGSLAFVPVGSENRIVLAGEWPHPSFTGDFLATTRSVSAAGFSAEWNVNGLACSAQQDLRSKKKGPIQQLGVDLIDPVNPYPLTDRAQKYGFLFIFITFAAFFLFELLADLRIHPIQYGFVGLAQALFFLLLLSLSEHVGFGASYFVASLATIGLIAFYVCHVLGGLRRGTGFGALLALLYGVLYVLLQSEDHALVAGSVFLFGLMAFAMLLTRKVDWYALGAGKKTP